VRVAVDGEPDPGAAGRADVVRRQVEPLRGGVDLQRGAGTGAGPEQLAEVRLDRRVSGWPMTLTCGFSQAATSRLVISGRDCSKCECTEATQMSSAPRTRAGARRSLRSCVAGQGAAAVVGHHVTESAGEIRRGPALGPVQLEVGTMEITDDPFGIEETGELS
jgi:hypothetical protein